MTDIIKADRLLERLSELRAKATPGEWRIWKEPTPTAEAALAELKAQLDSTEDIQPHMILVDAGGKCPALTGCGPTSEANAELIVALVNALPHLASRIQKAEASLSEQHRQIVEWLLQLHAAENRHNYYQVLARRIERHEYLNTPTP